MFESATDPSAGEAPGLDDPSRLGETDVITSVVDQVAVAIRRNILNGTLRPGESFSLRNIATSLGVSFIPVREALRILETQGLVITTPGKSAIVAPLSREDLQAIYRLRRRIEPDIAYHSADLLTQPDFERLEEMASSMGDVRFGIDAIYDSHNAFHAALLRPAATEWDMRVLEGLWHAGERYVRLTFSDLDAAPGEHERREQSHRQLLDAFRSRDPAKAALELRNHLNANECMATAALNELARSWALDQANILPTK